MLWPLDRSLSPDPSSEPGSKRFDKTKVKKLWLFTKPTDSRDAGGPTACHGRPLSMLPFCTTGKENAAQAKPEMYDKAERAAATRSSELLFRRRFIRQLRGCSQRGWTAVIWSKRISEPPTPNASNHQISHLSEPSLFFPQFIP